jgi:hypothetical protein
MMHSYNRDITVNTLRQEIGKATLSLLQLAREITWNKIPDNCKYILTEIKPSEGNLHLERQIRVKENNRKTPVTLAELMPELKTLFDNFYEINLCIHKATKELTIIDFRYYPKSLLDEEEYKRLRDNPPRLRCFVAHPPWLFEEKKKFNINWEHNRREIEWRVRWELFKMKLRGQWR